MVIQTISALELDRAVDHNPGLPLISGRSSERMTPSVYSSIRRGTSARSEERLSVALDSGVVVCTGIGGNSSIATVVAATLMWHCGELDVRVVHLVVVACVFLQAQCSHRLRHHIDAVNVDDEMSWTRFDLGADFGCLGGVGGRGGEERPS